MPPHRQLRQPSPAPLPLPARRIDSRMVPYQVPPSPQEGGHPRPPGPVTRSRADAARDRTPTRAARRIEPPKQRPAQRRRVPTSNVRAVAIIFGMTAGASLAALGVQTEETPNRHEPRLHLLSQDVDSTRDGVGGPVNPAPVLYTARQPSSPRAEVAQLRMAEQVRKDRIAREEAERERREREAAEAAARNRVVAPLAGGTITSNYGPRWGTTHYGLDIAAPLGTPIVAPKRGVVIEAGPASGFGLWVRIQHEDGTTTVYGHINSYSVTEGQRVEAGDVIAEVGNRGQSTGPHLHFEVWSPEGLKSDPLAWLQARGVNVG